jgi:hypothetical protein
MLNGCVWKKKLHIHGIKNAFNSSLIINMKFECNYSLFGYDIQICDKLKLHRPTERTINQASMLTVIIQSKRKLNIYATNSLLYASTLYCNRALH